jgi:DNA-binding NarL/FixJ family response regulator
MAFGEFGPIGDEDLRSMMFIDDHPLFSEGLRRALEAEMPDLRVETASRVAQAIAMLEGDRAFDLCLTDQRLGDGEGAELVDIVRRRFPLVAVGILTGEVTPVLVRRVRAAGAVACLSKERTIASLADAVRSLFDGGQVFDDWPPGPHDAITDRRREILRFAADGLLDKEIAPKLSITESTVRNHWQHIFERLGASNRTEAVSKAIRLGVI